MGENGCMRRSLPTIERRRQARTLPAGRADRTASSPGAGKSFRRAHYARARDELSFVTLLL
jgi:hypothetical protein